MTIYNHLLSLNQRRFIKDDLLLVSSLDEISPLFHGNSLDVCMKNSVQLGKFLDNHD
jgi:hypothetical protein